MEESQSMSWEPGYEGERGYGGELGYEGEPGYELGAVV